MRGRKRGEGIESHIPEETMLAREDCRNYEQVVVGRYKKGIRYNSKSVERVVPLMTK